MLPFADDCVSTLYNDAPINMPSRGHIRTNDVKDSNIGTCSLPKPVEFHDKNEFLRHELHGVVSLFQSNPSPHAPLPGDDLQKSCQQSGSHPDNLYISQFASLGRPKTSRGLNRGYASSNSTHRAEELANSRTATQSSPDEPCNSTRNVTTRSSEILPRNSVFYEQSMNGRSEDRASTWLGIKSESNEEVTPAHLTNNFPEEEITPRLSIASSIDIQEFNPPPTTPSTLKATLGRISRKFKSATEAEPLEDTTRPSRTESDAEKRRPKRLRRSISNWSIRNLPRKVKSSGALTRDAGKAVMSTDHDRSRAHIVEAVVSDMIQKTPIPQFTQSDVPTLSERKRKPESAYADHFDSVKRRKDSLGLAKTSSSYYNSPVTPTTRQHPFNSSNWPNANVDTYVSNLYGHNQLPSNTVPKLHFASLGSRSPVSATVEATSGLNLNGVDYCKRPSRLELEKENRMLRAMLREAQQSNRRKDFPGSNMSISSRSESKTSRKDIYNARDHSARGIPSPIDARVLRPLPQQPFVNRTTRLPAGGTDSLEQVSAKHTLKPSARNGVPPVPYLPVKITPGRKTSKVPHHVANSPNWTSCKDHNDKRGNNGSMVSLTASAAAKTRLVEQNSGKTENLPRPLSVVFEAIEDDYQDSKYAYEKELENVLPAVAEQERSPCRPSFDWDKDTF